MFVRVEKNPSNLSEFEQEHISMPEYVYNRLMRACNAVADTWDRYNSTTYDVNLLQDYESACDDLCTKVMMLMGFSFKVNDDVEDSGFWNHEGYVENNF